MERSSLDAEMNLKLERDVWEVAEKQYGWSEYVLGVFVLCYVMFFFNM